MVMQSMTLNEVAEKVFRTAPDWFYRNRRRLEDEHGFPRPLPGRGKPMLYDPLAIEAWLAARRDARGSELVQRTVTPEPDDAAEDLEAARQELLANIPAIAGLVGAE